MIPDLPLSPPVQLAILAMATALLVAMGLLLCRRGADQGSTPPSEAVGRIVAAVLVVAGLALTWRDGGPLRTAMLAAAGLALITWIDRRRPLWPSSRWLAAVLAITICLAELPDTLRLAPASLVPHLSRALELTALGALWCWWMAAARGIDAAPQLLPLHGLVVGGGAAGLLLWLGFDTEAMAPAAVLGGLLAGACLGVLGAGLWQADGRAPLGPTGQVVIGFLSGWLLLALAERGLTGAALAFGLVPLVDSAWTTGRGLAAGRPPWAVHAEHTVTRATRAGTTQRALTAAWALTMGSCLAIAVLGATTPWQALGAAGVAAAVWLWLVVGFTGTRARPAHSTRPTTQR